MQPMDEITAEYTTEQLVPPPPLRWIPRVTVAAKTDLGRVRENNEDKFEFLLAEDPAQLATKGHVFIVCDGMGGHAAGQIASELAAKTFIDVYLSHLGTETDVSVRQAVAAANRLVSDVARTIPGRAGMGTTLSALVLIQNEAVIAQVGDSRVYRLRDHQLELLTTDHTWCEEQIRLGNLTPEEAETHQYRHVLTRAIGADIGPGPDVIVHPLRAGDLFLLCSDGVMNHVSDAGIEAILRENLPGRAAWELVRFALEAGGSDNTTVLIVRVDALDSA